MKVRAHVPFNVTSNTCATTASAGPDRNEVVLKAVGYLTPLPIENSESLLDLEIEKPKLTNPHDLLVRVHGVSVNPVDYKIRQSTNPTKNTAKILGWDASGVVVEVGSSVSGFKPGDEIYWAGDIKRAGSNAEFQLVEERIVGFKPKNLDFETAAALPLTSITAYEALFHRLEIQRDEKPQIILVIGAAGGVGSIAIQLIKALTNHLVIATASRPESQQWCKTMGADFVIDHSKPLGDQIAALGVGQPKYVFSLNQTEKYLSSIAALIKPQGKFCLIDDPEKLDVTPLKSKSVSVHWELMFTRSLYQTEDQIQQQAILNHIAELVETGKIKPTANTSFGLLNAENLKRAHHNLESGKAIGKVTLRNI